MDVRRFLAELKGRGVYRVAALYAAGSWALLQIADIFFPLLGFPDWAITGVLAAAGLGFPIALILAWLFDITPEGIVETDTEGTNFGRLRLSPARLIELTLLMGLVFLVGFLYMDRLNLIGEVEQRASASQIEPARASIAVIPFVNMSAAKELEYFGDGLAEEILNLLARISELNVTARTSSFYFKNRDADIQEIAQRLGVRHILEGSVRRQGDRVRVTAQLINASDGFHMWSETYDRDFSDTFLIQDEIARKVVEKLQVLLSDTSKEILSKRPILIPEAYDYYLRGRDYLRSSLGEKNMQNAIELFGKAIDLDGGYAEAYAGLCDSYLVLYGLNLDPEHFRQAKLACETALSLGQGLPVYIALGNLYRYSGEYGTALAEFDKALRINPGAVDALIGLAKTYTLDNKPKQAEEILLQVIQLQPGFWLGYQSMGVLLYGQGRFQDAIPYYSRITELMPDNARAFSDLGAGYYMVGEFELAAEALQQSLKLDPTALAYANAGSSLFFLGRFEDAVDMYQKAVEYGPEDFQSWGALGDAYRYTEKMGELAEPMYLNAIKLATERLKINSADAVTLGLMAHYQASIGHREEALTSIARATALAPGNVYVYYNKATTLCALGETELATAALEKAFELGYLPKVAERDPSLCGLDDLPQVRSPAVAD